MAEIATKTEWVETDGIRRLVVEGAPIPPGLGLEDVKSDTVEARTLSLPVVDEEASKSMAERTGIDGPSPREGLSTENAENAVRGRRSRRQPSGSGDSE